MNNENKLLLDVHITLPHVFLTHSMKTIPYKIDNVKNYRYLLMNNSLVNPLMNTSHNAKEISFGLSMYDIFDIIYVPMSH